MIVFADIERLFEMPQLLFVLMFGGWIVTSVVHSLASNWRKARESEHMAVLKQQMIDRGMTVDDIEKVCNAGRGKPPHLMS
jgi:hypothetical protein